MALDQGVLDSVVNSNFKSLAEMGAINALGHQHRLQLLAESSLGQVLNRMNTLDPAEASSIKKVDNADIGKHISDLGAAIAGLQQLIKGAQSTPPETAKP